MVFCFKLYMDLIIMITKSDIKKKLNENSNWKPLPKASDEEWTIYQVVLEELGLDNKVYKTLDKEVKDMDKFFDDDPGFDDLHNQTDYSKEQYY